MPIRVKTGSSTWANVTELRVKTAISTWSDVIKGRVKTAASVWSDFFTATVTPTIQTRVAISLSGGINASNNIMNDSTAVVITSTRYSWNNADGFTYVWQSSPDDSNWTNIGTVQSTTNPSSGSSSSSLTLTLSPSYFTSGPNMYFRFKFMATNSTYGTNASSESLSRLVSYYGTPVPQSGSPSITGSTTVGNNAFGNIGVWTNSPTSYDYRWYFMSGITSYPLTFSQSRSVSNKSLSGFSASLSTSTNHGYKANDQLIISGMDSLFNGTHTITSRTNSTVSFTLPTPTAWSASTAYSIGSLVSYLGNAYYAAITMPAPTLYSVSSAYNIGDNAWDGFTRYRCIQALPSAVSWSISSGYSVGNHVFNGTIRYICAQSISAVSQWSSSTNYTSGSIVHFNGTRWRSEVQSGPGYIQGPQSPSSSNPVYWSEVNVSLSNSFYWTQINASLSGTSYWQNAYPYTSSYWTLQSFSNASASGTTTGPNYYEGTVSSSSSIPLTVPTADYKSGLDMISKALYFAVKAYNPATTSPSEYANYKIVYGFPVITLGTPTYPSGTQAQIPFTHSHMTKYNIDVTRAGISHTGYPTIITSSTSPINIASLTSGLTYTVNVYPINGEDTYGDLKTTSITTPNAPGVPTSLTRSVGNAGSKTFSWSAPTSGGTVTSYQYQLNSLGWVNNGSSTSVSLTNLSGTNTFQVRAVGPSLTGSPASTGSFTIPTINSGPTSSSVTSSSATISWTSTNQNSWSLSGVGSHTGTSETSKSVTLSASTSYTPSLTITSSTTDTATANGTQFTTPATSFTVTFDKNGGTGTMANQTANTATNLTAFGFTAPSGKGFSGWATSSSGSVVYANQASYPFTSSTTLYAIYYDLPTAPGQPVLNASTIGENSATITWTAPANGGSAITRYEGQLGSFGYINLGNVLTTNLTGLSSNTLYTYYVRAVNAVGTGTAGSVTFRTASPPAVTSVTQIVQTSRTTSPFATFVITCENALSVRINVDRASGATAPVAGSGSFTVGAQTDFNLSNNTVTVNSTTTQAPSGPTAWYRIRVAPYSGTNATGTRGTQVASVWKRHNTNSGSVTAPPFGSLD
jgi:hypothetical protein